MWVQKPKTRSACVTTTSGNPLAERALSSLTVSGSVGCGVVGGEPSPPKGAQSSTEATGSAPFPHASRLTAEKITDGGHKLPPARGDIYFSCLLNLGRDYGCLD